MWKTQFSCDNHSSISVSAEKTHNLPAQLQQSDALNITNCLPLSPRTLGLTDLTEPQNIVDFSSIDPRVVGKTMHNVKRKPINLVILRES